MKNILLAVSGLSPAVITETIYALYMEGRPVNELHIITTGEGKNRILQTIMSPLNSKIEALIADYAMPAIHYEPATNLHVLQTSSGRELNDLMTPDDNEILMYKCLELTHRFTAKSADRVYFLVAGGRKTMSSCLALAAQLYGRPQDRIFHVLLEPTEVERARSADTNDCFWYPPKEHSLFKFKDQQGIPHFINSKDIIVHLINMPFISIRDKLPKAMLRQVRNPGELIMSLCREEEPELTISIPEKTVRFGKSQQADLDPQQTTLYIFFAQQKKECCLPQRCADCLAKDCFFFMDQLWEDHNFTRINELYLKIKGEWTQLEATGKEVNKMVERSNLGTIKTRINKRLHKAFGADVAKKIDITSIKHPQPEEGRRVKYGILLERDSINIDWG